MTDQELNEAVARKLGWKSACLFPEDPKHHGFDCPFKTPDYCHSIEAAWEIAKFMCERGTSFDLNYGYDDRTWECSWITSDVRYLESADTAPMAICKAFLKLP